ncbi:MAG: zinc ribbon domain-containing protein [Pirellulaceae bacterium]
MPIYEYTCQMCRCDFEVLLRRGEAPECPQCGGKKLAKQFSVPAAHSGNSKDLPICGAPTPGACGMHACGTGGCPLE